MNLRDKKLGITGSRLGMSQKQVDKFRGLLNNTTPTEIHHGDCVGADIEAHHIYLEFLEECCISADNRIIIHPPINHEHRAFGRGEILPEKTYFQRNRNIVANTDYLVAFPAWKIQKGGTWYTINYAIKQGKPTFIIMPDGTVHKHNLGEY